MGCQAAGVIHDTSGAAAVTPTMQAAAPQNSNAMAFEITTDATRHIDREAMDITVNTGRTNLPQV